MPFCRTTRTFENLCDIRSIFHRQRTSALRFDEMQSAGEHTQFCLFVQNDQRIESNGEHGGV